MQQRLVRDLMRIRHGHVVSETATLREVAERLIVSDCDILAVTDIAGSFCGIVCESSVVRALMANAANIATIESIVSRHAESIRLDATLNSVLPMFRSSGNTAIPVINDVGRVCGLLMRRDVIGNLLHRRIDAIEQENRQNTSTTGEMRTMLPAAPQIKPPARKTNDMIHDSEATGNVSKPHFLRAAEARQVLWSAEDRL